MLMPLMPTLVCLPSPSQLKRVESTLAMENEVRRSAEAEVRKSMRTGAASGLPHADYKQALEDLRGEMRPREDLEQQLIQAQKMEAVGGSPAASRTTSTTC